MKLLPGPKFLKSKFFETKVFETDTETFFRDQIFSRPIPCQVFLYISSCFVSYFRPDLVVEPFAGGGGDGVVHSVQVDGVPEHLFRRGGCLASDTLGLSVESMVQHFVDNWVTLESRACMAGVVCLCVD